ncbi:1704_t:CDS:1, partial [Gigaspora margarita]
MNYSCNIRAYALYFGILGAFLKPTNNSFNDTSNNSIHSKTLHLAIIWLAQNNPYLYSFAFQLASLNNSHPLNNPFPITQQAQYNTKILI